MIEVRDIVYDNSHPESCILDMYLPDDVKNPPVYIYFHGGYLTKGSRRVKHIPKKAEYLTDNGIALVSVDYRLYPNAKFPDYINDAAKAVAYIRNESILAPCGGGLTVGGSSAGAYIVMMLYFNSEYLQTVNMTKYDIDGFLFDSGLPTAHLSVMSIEKGLDPRCVIIDDTAPFYYLREEYKEPEKEPYVFIAYSDHDMVNREEQLKMLKATMLEFKFPEDKLIFKVYENEAHCSYLAKDFYLADTAEFVKKAAAK